MTQAQPALRITNLSKRYGKTWVLREIDLELENGEFFGLVGVNGAGKTTLIKCLLDFCEPDAGSIEIFGVPARLTISRSRLAFLPERFAPPHYLTGKNFLSYALTLQAVNFDQERVAKLLRTIDLDEEVLTLPVRVYSKGMTQKLGLAACLLSGKRFYVFDEPTTGLDPKARALLKNQLRALREDNKTVFFTSHSLAEVEEICDRMAVLHAGRLMFVGTPSQLTEKFGGPNLEQAFLACIDQSPDPVA